MNIDHRKVKVELLRRSGTSTQPEQSTESLSIVKTFNCSETESVGDVVRSSDIDDNTVIKCVDNRHLRVAIGIIKEKLTSTTCNVVMIGYIDQIFPGLSKGNKVFLSLTGSLTTTPPTTGYVQTMGNCYEDNRVFLKPENKRLKKNPF